MVYRQSPHQLSFESFGCGLSTPLSPDNEWVQLADIFPWEDLDKAYQLEFPKNSGQAAKPFRMMYGTGLIQDRMKLTDRGIVDVISASGSPTFPNLFAISSMIGYVLRSKRLLGLRSTS
jgi:hypothetical protein